MINQFTFTVGESTVYEGFDCFVWYQKMLTDDTYFVEHNE
jgi:hypothetical protein